MGLSLFFGLDNEKAFPVNRQNYPPVPIHKANRIPGLGPGQIGRKRGLAGRIYQPGPRFRKFKPQGIFAGL
jgi:hypothetical protein